MATRWQLSLWVLAGLTLSVIALWERASVSAVTDRVTERTEAVDGSDRPDADGRSRSDLAFGDLGGSGSADGGSNVLRPTTTTTTRPTTTSTSTAGSPEDLAGDATGVDGQGSDGEHAPGSATTTPIHGDGDPSATTSRDGSSSTTPNGSSTTVTTDPTATTVYSEDFADGALVDGRWSIANSVGRDGWGLLRPSAVTVQPDPSAAGGHVLAITARMGNGPEAGRVVSGAVRLNGHQLTHGRYTIRARVDADPDRATAGVVLLRPVSADDTAEAANEIRIVETTRNRSTRAPVESTLRWTGAGGADHVRAAHRTADGPVSAATWHVYTLEWTADGVTVAVDGQAVNLTVDPTRAPQGPMDLAIRLDPLDTPTAPGEQPVLSTEVRLLIDWIRIERFSGESSP